LSLLKTVEQSFGGMDGIAPGNVASQIEPARIIQSHHAETQNNLKVGVQPV
jgi:hypothetical protein